MRNLTLMVTVPRPCGNPDHDYLSDEEYVDALTQRIVDAISMNDGPVPAVSSPAYILSPGNESIKE